MKIENLKLKITKNISIVGIILFAVVLRLLPHPANVAPIAALALFGGAYLDKKFAIIVPLVAMLISDFFLGFHDTMVFVYGSFVLVSLIGIWVKTHKHVGTVIGASLVSSVLFFLITNFGVWVMGTMYAKSAAGLLDCYINALPFFRNTILGDLLYIGVFFGAYELILSLIRVRVHARTSKNIS